MPSKIELNVQILRKLSTSFINFFLSCAVFSQSEWASKSDMESNKAISFWSVALTESNNEASNLFAPPNAPPYETCSLPNVLLFPRDDTLTLEELKRKDFFLASCKSSLMAVTLNMFCKEIRNIKRYLTLNRGYY